MKQFVNFEKLPEEKKIKLINAGLELFSQYGYDQTPTDLIIKKAQISKGALFLYFENKENFFIYLFDYASKKLINEVNPNPPQINMDIFDYLPYVTKQKIDLLSKFPYLMNFVMKAYEQNYQLLKDKGGIDFFENYQKQASFIYDKIDFTTLKEDIFKERFISWVTMISQGFVQTYIQFPSQIHDKLINDLYALFDQLKKSFRKEKL